MLSLVMLILSLAAEPGFALTQPFSEGCPVMDGQFYGQDKVGFYCFTQNEHLFYDYMYSTIDFRHCVGNNLGTLIGYDNGNYQESCDNCTLHSVRRDEASTCFLKCECYDMDGRKQVSELDLNDVLKVTMADSSALDTKELATVFHPSVITTLNVRREPQDLHLARARLDWRKTDTRCRSG